MDITRIGCMPAHRVELCGKKEIEAAAVGMMLYEEYSDDDEASDHIDKMKLEGKAIEKDDFSFCFNTSRSHERLVLEGLTWVVQNKEDICSRFFHEVHESSDVITAMEIFDQIGLSSHLEELAHITEHLQTAGVITVK
jgi:hypothetical protein